MNYTIDEVKNILASKKSQICNLGISHTVLTVIQDLLEYQTPKIHCQMERIKALIITVVRLVSVHYLQCVKIFKCHIVKIVVRK